MPRSAPMLWSKMSTLVCASIDHSVVRRFLEGRENGLLINALQSMQAAV
jgi:hypothetical protein